MGYRSDVAFAISKKAYFKYKTILQKPLTFLDDADQKYTNEFGHYFLTYSVKWYELHDGVQEMEQLMTELEEEDEDPDMCYAFCRIGEDDDDIAIAGDTYYFHLFIKRDFDTPHNLDKFTG